MLSCANGIFRFRFSKLNMVLVDFSDTLVQTHQNTRHQILGDRKLNTNSKQLFGFGALACAVYIT
jgi:hypothetical protein